MSLEVTNMSVVSHVIHRIYHCALVAKSGGIRFSGFKTGEIFARAIGSASANRAEAGCCIKAKGFVGVKCHFFLRCANVFLHKKIVGAT